LAGTKFWVDPLAEVGWFRARLVLPVPPVPVSVTVVGLFDALLVMVRFPVRVPDAVGVNVTLTVHDPPAAIDAPQVLVSAKSPDAATWDMDAAAVSVLVTVTGCAPLVVLTAWLPNVSEVGFADKAGPEEPPAAGKTSKSDSWPAGHPVLAVMFARTYRAVVALNVMVTVLLLAFGSKVYPVEPTMVEKFEPSAEPSSDNVSVRVFQAVDGGSLSTTLPML
jgi:hypothetical protein